MRAGLLAMMGVSALSLAVGCGEPKEGKLDESSAAPEALTLDVFTGRKLTTTCSATLLTRRVALTSARCFKAGGDSAAIHAPDAQQNKWADVASVHVYDDKSDIAVLVLEGTILIPKYPRISGEDFEAESVHQTYRTDEGPAIGDVVRISREVPAPNAMYVSRAQPDVGGSFYFENEDGKHVIAGITLGNGEKRKGAYVVKLTDRAVRTWIKDIVAEAAGTTETSSVKTAALHGPDVIDADDAEVEIDVALTGAKKPTRSPAESGAFTGGIYAYDDETERLAPGKRRDVACKTSSTFVMAN